MPSMPARDLERSLNVVLNRIVQRLAEALCAVQGLFLLLRLAGFLIPAMGRTRVLVMNAIATTGWLLIALAMRHWRKRAGTHEIGWFAVVSFQALVSIATLRVEQDPLRLATCLILLPIASIFIRRRILTIAAFATVLGCAALGPFLLTAPLSNTGYFVATLILALAIGIVLHLMVNLLLRRVRTLFHRLQVARSEARELAGFLPICAWCKSIRDDEGYWQQVEAYLARRSQITFTHGMCPNCRKKVAEEFEGKANAVVEGREGILPK